MTNPTFPVAPLAGRTLKWAADGSETLINSECDPDLVAAQACQSAAAAVEAAVSTKTAAFASGAKAAEAAGSAAQAAASATLATTKAAEAACSVTAVTTVVDEAVTAAANAAQSAAQAEGQALSAAAYAATATGAASQVTAAASQAADAAISASNAADAAAASATQAAGSTTSATGAANTATTAVTTATAAAESAVQAASAAESSAMAAQGSATQASGLATIAINAATEAAGSATQAAAVAVQALDSAQNAADWAVKMDGPVSGGEHSAKWHAASIVGLAGRVRVSDADTTGGFLGAKVVPGALLSVAVDNPGGNEQVRIGVADANLAAFAGLANSADHLPVFAGNGAMDTVPVTAIGRAVLAAADAGAARTAIAAAAESHGHDSGAITDFTAAVEAVVAGALASGGSLPVGTVTMFGGASAPSGWLRCDGSTVSRSTYGALFAVLGTTYGPGDGATTFALPDLRGRAPIGAGQGSGLTNRTLGANLGEETHVLTEAEMPSHNHTYDTKHYTGPSPSIGGGEAGFGPVNTSSTGGNAPHNTMQPSLAVTFIIKT